MKAARMDKDLVFHQNFDETRETFHRQMLSTVSHDLKTPLATIIGSLEVYTRMADKLPEDKKRMLIQSAMGEAYRLDQFITNILDMAKLENGMVKIRNERCDLGALLQDCVTRIGPRAQKGSIEVKPVAQVVAQTDMMLLSRAVNILLDNALKHGGTQPHITMEYGTEGDTHFIIVADNGPGIDAGKEEAIFSKYTRFSKGDQKNAGTGLGLAICRQLMCLLSGMVSVKNMPDGGVAFRLDFPSM